MPGTFVGTAEGISPSRQYAQVAGPGCFRLCYCVPKVPQVEEEEVPIRSFRTSWAEVVLEYVGSVVSSGAREKLGMMEDIDLSVLRKS